jgi:hypothetical protein
VKLAVVGSKGYPKPEDMIDHLVALSSGSTVLVREWDPMRKDIEDFARSMGLAVEMVRHDKGMSPSRREVERNCRIVFVADEVAVFWDGVCSSAKMVLNQCTAQRKPCYLSVRRAESKAGGE